ncbi:MAG: aminodeoxychorismate lyase [Sulfuricella sp.]|nr:aminodeoxychorismate lyase [Sulfuricella sp.]
MILVNGQEEERISVRDRGLAYGDGIFRTLTAREGELQYWERQYAKLYEDCLRLDLPCPSELLLRQECEQVSYGQRKCVVKIVVTRGQGNRGYAFPKQNQPTRIVMRADFPHYPEDNWRIGIKVRLCEIRLAEQPALAGIKHLNRLENVLARSEWGDPAIAEGLLLDHSGNVIEGVASNLFMVKDGVLVTPDLRRCGVAGVTRERILEWAKQARVETEIRDIHFDELRKADECIVCNSLIGIWPVRELEDLRWKNTGLVPQIHNFFAEFHD